MICGAGAGMKRQSSECTEITKSFGGGAVQEAVAVVSTECDDSGNKSRPVSR